MISSSSDTLTVGIILLLLFGAICFYLYSRIIQGEKKISLLENILLDLKVATESSMLNIPDQTESLYMNSSKEHVMSAMSAMSAMSDMMGRHNDNTINEIDETDDVLESMRYEIEEEEGETSSVSESSGEVDIVKRIMEENNEPLPTPLPVEQKHVEVIGDIINNGGNAHVFVNKTESAYEHMTVKELQAIAKSKGLSVSGLKRAQVIEALKVYDNAPASTPVSSFSGEESQAMSFDDMGEVNEPVPMDAPGTLMEANFIE
jgi:hypothetical protein